MYVYVDREIEAGDGDITKCVTRRLNGTLRKVTHLVTTLKYRRWLRRILFVKMEINRPGIGGREKEIVGAR